MSEHVPTGLRYSKEHEWARLDGDVVTVGVTHFAQDSLGDIVYIDLPETGVKLQQFDKFGEIESVKAVSDLFTPVGGAIAGVNGEAVDNPELVNTEPYEGGWLVRLSGSDAGELDNLLTAQEYEALLAESG